MVLSAHQPNYLPWPGFFQKMARCDVFVLLDAVQYARRSYTARCLVKGADGKKHWLTVPVFKTGRYHQTVAEVEIDNQDPWQNTHRRTLESVYAKAPYFREHQWLLDLAYGKPWNSLCELNTALITALAERLDIKPRIVRLSELSVEGHSTELLVGICRKLGADTYRSGPSGKKYLDEEKFQMAGIKCDIFRYWPEPYPQLWGDFVPGLSLVDLLFNCGPEVARREIRKDS
ncbi:MAG: WbqC family protein [Candidatus Edwardsbacteria bacterium]|nr:WbqC family protein [Candidatus Edwardsbacteria bacterium]